MKKAVSWILAAILFLSGTAVSFAYAAGDALTETEAVYPAGNPEEVSAVILHTNDVHVGYQDNIGYDGLALYKKELESLYGSVLLVDAGDAIQGAALGTLSKGKEIIRMMNRLGYDLAVPGNHEFDYGFDALDECAGELSCGYTCANFCTADGEPVFEPWRILEAGGLKIGFVGTVTPDTFSRSAIKDIVNEVGEPMYDFLADATGDRLSEALQQSVDEARGNGADYVILVAHLGSDTESESIYTSNAVVGKMTGVDAVFDAHSHEIYNTQIPDRQGNMIPIAQAGTKLPMIGQLTIYRDGRLEETLVDPVPLLSGFAADRVTRKKTERYVDLVTEAFLDGITASYDAVMKQKIGSVSVDLLIMEDNTELNRIGENGLCELVADTMRDVGGAQAAICNAGTLRTNLYAGEITYQDIINILPYSNGLVTVRTGGQTILDALEFGVSWLPAADGGFPQVSGITYCINPEIESSVIMDEKKQFVSVEGERRVSDVTIGGEPVDPDRSYTLAISKYLLTGGNGYTMFKDAEIVSDPMLADNELLIQYIGEQLHGEIPVQYAEPQGWVRWAGSSGR